MLAELRVTVENTTAIASAAANASVERQTLVADELRYLADEARIISLECLAGVRTEGCESSPVIHSADHFAAAQSAACQVGRRLEDQMDEAGFLANAARAFNFLELPRDPGETEEASSPRSFQRIEISSSSWDSTSEAGTLSYGAVLDRLFAADRPHGFETMTLTKHVAGGSMSRAMASLQASGVASVELGRECSAGADMEQCYAVGLLDGYEHRALDVHVRLEVDPGYGLGQTWSEFSTGVSARTPVDGWRIRVSHGTRHSFLREDMTWIDLDVPNRAAIALCEWVERSGHVVAPSDCENARLFDQEIFFTDGDRDRSDVGFPTEEEASESTWFRSSLAGEWTVDMSSTIENLNAGFSGNTCYQSPMPVSCLPSECLSPCFAPDGTRLGSAAGAPAECSCYDEMWQLRSGVDGCSGLPQNLAWWDGERGPGYCWDVGGGRPALETLCEPFFEARGEGFPYFRLAQDGNPACCDHGRARVNEDGTVDAECASVACDMPAECLRSCGDRCKTMKSALNAVTVRIPYTAQR